MGSVEMSLDDIIRLTKQKSNTSGGGRGGNKRNNGNGSGPRQGFRSRGAPRTGRSTYVDHDAPRGSPVISGGNINKMVRVNISNLAASVSSADLEELFASYNLETATVHFNERGESCGTGDIYLRKKDAERVVKDFRGVALDGLVLKMLLADGAQDLSSRVNFGPRISGGIRKRESDGGQTRGFRSSRGDGGGFRRDGGGRKAGGGGRKNDRPKKSEAELDAELDAYMKKPKI